MFISPFDVFVPSMLVPLTIFPVRAVSTSTPFKPLVTLPPNKEISPVVGIVPAAFKRSALYSPTESVSSITSVTTCPPTILASPTAPPTIGFLSTLDTFSKPANSAPPFKPLVITPPPRIYGADAAIRFTTCILWSLKYSQASPPPAFMASM